jgi:23S rRNA pseudouridine1911/1915/1917 synthase
MNSSEILSEFTVENYLSGVRVDSFLSKHLRNYTSWRLHRLVVAGAVRIDDLPAEPQQRVFRGQRVAVRLLEPPDKLLAPCEIPLRVIYEDPWIIVVDKPPGIVAHPVGDFHDATLSNALQSHFDRQTGVRGLLRPGVVHRLDRMTSGLLVAAKEHHAHRILSIDFQHGRLSKSYLALLEGRLPFQERLLDNPIGQRPGRNSVLMSASPDARNPRPARTRVTLQQQFDGCALVKCTLLTGRNHQIRVHCAHYGHPVIGDEYYGPFGRIRRAPRFEGEQPCEQRHALHASQLAFLHPVLKEWVEFRSEPPEDFFRLMPSGA